MKWILVATDGSARANPNGPAGWAWYVDKQRYEFGSLPKASNQVAELYAIMKALAAIPKHLPVHIQTDSSFWVRTIGEDAKSGWMFGWKRNGWKKKDGKVPANLVLLKKLEALLASRRAATKLEWVRGHNGHELNEIVDGLCTRASASMLKGVPLNGGPGWASAVAPVAPRPTSAAPAKKKPATRRKVTPQRDVIVSFYDDDDAPMVIKKQVDDDAQYCGSCNGRINLATGECRCSI